MRAYWKKSGFTLVELLVCIAILMLLFALLFPIIVSMRENAMRVVCTSNLRQVSVLWVAYVTDHHGWFPYRNNAVQTYDQLWGKTGNGNAAASCPAEKRIFGVVFPEIDVRIYKCPSDTGAEPGWWPEWRKPTMYDWYGASFFFNTSASKNSSIDGLFGKNVSQIPHPSDVVAAGDYSFTSAYFLGWDPFTPAYWHNKKELGWGNVLFVDGGVRYLQVPSAAYFQQGAGYTFFWDGPR
jgi:prepilin-type N-terminal cleavage/methylation domain-containing protein/prepilin-type processing-associated H-X9-DG protein